jgi:hypothetical protein
MRCYYKDIFDLAGTPKWFDEFGVPRYRPFAPDAVANTFASEVALVRIACCGCGKTFEVAFSRPSMSPIPKPSIAEDLTDARLSYGASPNVDCCEAGRHMDSITRGALEYWRRSSSSGKWVRDRRFEAALGQARVCRKQAGPPLAEVTVGFVKDRAICANE